MYLSQANIAIFLYFVVPGIIIKKLLSSFVMRHEDKTFYLDSILWSIINYSITGIPLTNAHLPFMLQYFIIIFVSPVIIGLFVGKILTNPKSKDILLSILNISFNPMAWDEYFSRREMCWVLITLNDDTKIGGYFGERSYASSTASGGDIYIEEVYSLDDDFKLIEPVDRTKGVIVDKREIKYVEFFKIQKEDSGNGR